MKSQTDNTVMKAELAIFEKLQDAGIPMVLFADGTVEVDHYKGYACLGTWEVEGSGSGEGTLVIKNEKGEAIAIKQDGTSATYAQEGVY